MVAHYHPLYDISSADVQGDPRALRGLDLSPQAADH